MTTKRVQCPECGHQFNVSTAIEQYAVRMVAMNISAAIAGAALLPMAGAVVGVDVHPLTGCVAALGVANLYAVFDVRDGINRLHGKRQVTAHPGAVLRQANVFATLMRAIPHGDGKQPARRIITERQVMGRLTDADVYRFIDRCIVRGVARRHHLEHLTRDEYDGLVTWLVSIGIIIGRTGNQSGRIITPTAGRAMLVVYQHI